MKILELRFKNLNSLYGEWTVDFTHPEYVSNGIFALTGPTGAGKSTILDAVCLALYGATPRLGKITKAANEIMSRQTGECYAEVLFESQAGKFRCHWEQRRARKKSDGALQEPMHQLADESTGKPIETKRSFVVGAIEEKTGMDFDRFTRSILLAQGGFDTFLKAEAETKSKILEQITGTEIYSDISRRVHERQREEREKLNLLSSVVSGIAVLEDEQVNAMQQDLEAKQRQEAELAEKSSQIIKAVAWLNTVEGLKKELLELNGAADEFQAEVDAFAPDSGRLERARRAMSMDAVYATVTANRQQRSADQCALRDQEAVIPGMEASAKKQAGVLRDAEQLTHKTKDDLKEAMPLIQKIRSLDQRIAEQANNLDAASAACAKEAETIEAEKRTRAEVEKKRIKTEDALRMVEQYLEEHTRDEWLIGGLTGIKEQLKSLAIRQKEITQKEAIIKKAEAAATKASEKFAESVKQRIISEHNLTDAEKKLKLGEAALSEMLGGKELREYRAQKETLLREMAYIKKIEELERERTRLEDGKPCPLCGSPTHPFAEGNIPLPDEIECAIESLDKLILGAEEQEEVIKALKEAETGACKKLGDSEKLETVSTNEKNNAEQYLAMLQDGMAKLHDDFDELELTVCQKLLPLGISEIAKSQIPSLAESLKRRLQAWRDEIGRKTEFNTQIADIDTKLKSLDAIIETRGDVLAEKLDNFTQRKDAHARSLSGREELYGDKKPDNEEARLEKVVVDAEDAEKNARRLNVEAQQNLTTAIDRAESLRKRIQERDPEVKNEEAKFSLTLQKAGFANEKQFIAARLPNEERESLAVREKELNDAQAELKTKRGALQKRLDSEGAKKITDKTLDELTPLNKECENVLNELRNAVAGLKYKLGENDKAKERIKEKQAAVEAQKRECQRWDKLHGLIGSADGKKYRNFAQGLTFELMVTHANRQLEKMSDRYLLIRGVDQPLDLNVVDNYQAGEIRSTKNLSGGESFIVSLTLALGLSKMASRKVRVDSLFLDEGFGTLDEDALETALEALSGLQQDGKLIGIISHVSALKERIGTQITITPVSGGRSSFSGPGCIMAEKDE